MVIKRNPLFSPFTTIISYAKKLLINTSSFSLSTSNFSANI